MCLIIRDPDQDNLSSLINFQNFISRLRVTKSGLFVYNLLYDKWSCTILYFYKDLLFSKNNFSLLQYVLNESSSGHALNCAN